MNECQKIVFLPHKSASKMNATQSNLHAANPLSCGANTCCSISRCTWFPFSTNLSERGSSNMTLLWASDDWEIRLWSSIVWLKIVELILSSGIRWESVIYVLLVTVSYEGTLCGLALEWVIYWSVYECLQRWAEEILGSGLVPKYLLANKQNRLKDIKRFWLASSIVLAPETDF